MTNEINLAKEVADRTDIAMILVLSVALVCIGLAQYVHWFWALVIGVVLVSFPLAWWTAAAFRAWDQGGPAGQLRRKAMLDAQSATSTAISNAAKR